MIQFYSDVLDKLFNTAKEAEDAEFEYKTAQKTKEIERKALIARLYEERDAANKALADFYRDFRKLLNSFDVPQYRYSMDIERLDDGEKAYQIDLQIG